MSENKNSTYTNDERWFIEALSENLKEHLGKSEDSRIVMLFGKKCIDRNGKLLGPKDIYWVPADEKDRIFKARIGYEFSFVIYRCLGEGAPMVYNEYPSTGIRVYPKPRRRRLKQGQRMFAGVHLVAPIRSPQVRPFGKV